MKGKTYSGSYLLVILTCFCFLLIFNSWAEIYGAGNENTYMFVDCGQTLYSPSETTTICFDLKYHIEGTGWDRIAGFFVPLQITSTSNSLLSIDTTVASAFPPASGVSDFTIKEVRLWGSGPDSFHVVYGAINFNGGITGDGLFARICLQISDTGIIYIDTLFAPPSGRYLLTEEGAVEFKPGWGGPPDLGYPPGGAGCGMAPCIRAYAVGTGYGVLSDFRDHLDTYYDCYAYQLKDITRRANNNPHGHNGLMPPSSAIITQMPGGVMTDSDNIWNDSVQGPGVDAHVYTGLIYDYLLHNLGRNSFNGLGKSMVTTVEISDPNIKNFASFDQDLDQVKIYQAEPDTIQGQVVQRYSYAGCLDVIAQQWAHGIIKYTSNLRRSGEAGALHESFCDMFGATVAWANGGPDWWLIGQNSYDGPYFDRSMADPTATDQPDTYGGQNWYAQDTCPAPNELNDSCGVHKNMGVPNKMFYLLAKGGTHNGIAVTGIEIENAMKIMYRANILYWDSTASFRLVDAAAGATRAAFDLDSSNLWALETSRAWTAVQVCTTLAGDVNASGAITLGDVIYLANYIFKGETGGRPIVPLCRGDADGSGKISIVDVVRLALYVFDKDRLPCLGSDPINCWLPIPSDVCCRLP